MTLVTLRWLVAATIVVLGEVLAKLVLASRPLKRRFALVGSLIAACSVLAVFLFGLLYTLGFVCSTPASRFVQQCTARGSIVLSEPQVFTRERLVNDRLREER